MEDKITIIEGPTPTFEMIADQWAMGLQESTKPATIALTRLRTFNGSALVERCYTAWRNHHPMHLVYRLPDGLQAQAPIVAARAVETTEGPVLLLWVRLNSDEIEVEYTYSDSDSDADDDDWDINPPDEPFDPNTPF